MGQANWLIIPISALIPVILGFIWYHPIVLGKTLAKNTGRSIAEITPSRSIGKIALTYLFSFLLSYILTLVSVHQAGVFQLFFLDPSFSEPGSEFAKVVQEFMDKYGDRHRTFGHGLIHGAEFGVFTGLAAFGVTALSTGKSLKSIWVHLGFWIVCCALIASVNCGLF